MDAKEQIAKDYVTARWAMDWDETPPNMKEEILEDLRWFLAIPEIKEGQELLEKAKSGKLTENPTNAQCIREALESMLWQHAHRGAKDGKPSLYTGGLSANEEGFEALGWRDPHFISEDEAADVCCDVEGCVGFRAAQGGMWAETGYWMLCHDHCEVHRNGGDQPMMKQRAIDREASRGDDGCLPLASGESR